jgi:neutral ceramidase
MTTPLPSTPTSTQLRAGVARIACATRPGLALSGFSARVLPSTATHDPIWARALVIATDDAVSPLRTALVSVDVLGLDTDDVRWLRHRIHHETGIDHEAILIAATHTHSAPAAMPRRDRMGEVDPIFWSELCDAIVAAVVRADASSTPATLSLGVGLEATVARNRRVVDGPIDPAVSAIRVDTDGALAALVFSYACHPVALGPANTQVSADYPGYAVRATEAVYPGSIGIFLTGCAGQLNTGHLERTFEEAARLGRAVAGAAIQAAEQAGPPAGRPLAHAPDKTGRPGVSWFTVQVALPQQALGTHVHDERTVDADVTALRWGSIIVVGLPGEPFMELGQQIRERCGVGGVVVIGYSNGCPGYIPDPSAYREGGYEVCDAHHFYGESSAFSPAAAGIVVEAALQAIAYLIEPSSARGIRKGDDGAS